MEPDQDNTPFSHAVRIASLIYKVREKEMLTDEEQADLNVWIKENDRHAELFSGLQDRKRLVQEIRELADYDVQLAVKGLFARLGIKSVREGQTSREGRKSTEVQKIRMIRRWMSAAAVFLLVATGAWIYVVRERGVKPLPSLANKNDVAPGTNRALLILGDGSTIALDSAHNGQLARQGGTMITRQNGQVVYNATAANTPGGKTNGDKTNGGKLKEVEYNTMTTPRGGQYRLVLPDGSRVLLNAASSLRYPTAFTGNERIVELSGEAYFDITKNKSLPFVVKTTRVNVKVLGTDFDVMAYMDEPRERTTLVDGSVQVSMGSQVKTLKPGQQALVSGDGSGFVIMEADVDKEIAWTTGFFKFDHTDIQTIMREISRWYDIEVIYESKMDDSDTYSGRISRNLNLSDLASFLEGNGIHHFQIDGKKMRVLP